MVRPIKYFFVIFVSVWKVCTPFLTYHQVYPAYVLVDLFVSGFPVCFYHFVFPILYGFSYSIFNIVYISLGGTWLDGDIFIYKMVDLKANHTRLVLWPFR